MTGKDYSDLRETLIALNVLSHKHGYNYTLQTTYRYDPKKNMLQTRNWIYKWRNNGSKYDEMIPINDIIDAIEYISREINNYTSTKK